MVAIITGDITNSRRLTSQEVWLNPLKALFSEWGQTPAQWELYRGDSFQLEISKPENALGAAMRIKAMIKSVQTSVKNKRTAEIDVRMAIGLGKKDFNAKRISECNGSAFVFSGETLDRIKKEKITLALKSEWPAFNAEMNLYLRLAIIKMDSWSISSGELVNVVLQYPDRNQSEIGKVLGIEQNSVSGRYNRAHVEEILAMEHMYREKLKQYLS